MEQRRALGAGSAEGMGAGLGEGGAGEGKAGVLPGGAPDSLW